MSENNNRPMFSIITPCYNSAKTIGKTFEYMQKQTFRDFEHIIIDGGSTDGTVDLIREYQAKYPDTVRYVSEPDNGIYDAMNKGIRMARGTLVGINNSDDFYEPTALEAVARQYRGEQYAVFYGMERIIQDGIEESVIIRSPHFLPARMIEHPSCFVTNDTYRKFGLYSLEFKSASDYDYMLLLSRTGQVQFIPIYSILSNFNWGGVSCNEIGVEESIRVKIKYGFYSKRVLYRYYWGRANKRFIKAVKRLIGKG